MEVFFMGRQNESKEFETIVKELKVKLKKVADKYGLFRNTKLST